MYSSSGRSLSHRCLGRPAPPAQIFRVKLTGERGRVHQITEQYGELAALGLRGVGGPSSADWTARGMVVGDGSLSPIHTSASPSSSTASRWPLMGSVFKSSR